MGDIPWRPPSNVPSIFGEGGQPVGETSPIVVVVVVAEVVPNAFLFLCFG